MLLPRRGAVAVGGGSDGRGGISVLGVVFFYGRARETFRDTCELIGGGG